MSERATLNEEGVRAMAGNELSSLAEPLQINAEERSNALTYGSWETETASVAALDQALSAELWSVYREVQGTIIHPRPVQVDKSLRIDRILVPKPALIRRGWAHGAIGIECKCSGKKLGPVIAQAMDYGRATWKLPGNVQIWLDWVFIWPMRPQHGPLASILAQNRIGSADAHHPYKILQLKSGEQNILRIDSDGSCTIGAGGNGRRVGSR